jgi:tetratricopeptide (TPR) repeat protein
VRRPQSAYEILGLPRQATSVQVRARYRQLARRFRPELNLEQIFDDPDFRPIANAFLTLISADTRREYSRDLRERRDPNLPDMVGQMGPADLRLAQAEVGILRGQLRQAQHLCKEALQLDSRQARGWALLGDIMRQQARWDKALEMYNYAIQFDPSNQRYWQLLAEVNAIREGRAAPRTGGPPAAGVWRRPTHIWGVVGGGVIFVELSILYLLYNPTAPGPIFDIPNRVLLVAALDGLLLGLILGATNILDRFDDELIYYSITGYGVQLVPLGIFVVLPGLVCFWAAIFFYGLVAITDAHLSFSVSTMLALTAVLTVVYAFFIYPATWLALLVFGGNFVFVGFAVGWLLGGLRLRLSRG